MLELRIHKGTYMTLSAWLRIVPAFKSFRSSLTSLVYIKLYQNGTNEPLLEFKLAFTVVLSSAGRLRKISGAGMLKFRKELLMNPLFDETFHVSYKQHTNK